MIYRDSIQISASILAQNLKSITDHLSTHRELFEKSLVYPSTNFPGRTQENLALHLLRKKLEPGVESWVEEGRALNEQEVQSSTGQADGKDDLDDLWTFAKDFIVPRVVDAARMHRRENYTIEEQARGIENVKTGLRVQPRLRQTEEDDEEDDDSDEDEDDDEEMKDRDEVEESSSTEAPKPTSGPARNIDEITRFMITGLLPEDEPHLYQQPNPGTRR